MSFVAGRGVNVLAAVTTAYTVVHPKLEDANSYNSATRLPRYKVVEVCNGTTGLIYIAFDRPAVAPVGNGIQGNGINVVNASNGGPYAATSGDFDLCIVNGSWPATDISVPPKSDFMTILSVAAGSITVTYGGDLGG